MLGATSVRLRILGTASLNSQVWSCFRAGGDACSWLVLPSHLQLQNLSHLNVWSAVSYHRPGVVRICQCCEAREIKLGVPACRRRRPLAACRLAGGRDRFPRAFQVPVRRWCGLHEPAELTVDMVSKGGGWVDSRCYARAGRVLRVIGRFKKKENARRNRHSN